MNFYQDVILGVILGDFDIFGESPLESACLCPFYLYFTGKICIKFAHFSGDCWYGPASDDGHPVWPSDQERDVPDRLPALQGAAVQADGDPEEHQPQLREVHHPQPREEGWQDQRSACP